MIPGLKQSLLDPVPEVRTVSARALGAMVKGMGSNKFDELMNWLMETLKSEGSSVDRSGAAQGKRESSKTKMVMKVIKTDQEYERNFHGKSQGSFVQSVVSLTSSLRVISLTVLADSIYNILIFFAEKV